MNDLRILTSANCRFSRSESGNLRIEIEGDLCGLRVVIRRLFPIRMPKRYLSVSDGKAELGIIEDLEAFDGRTRKWIDEELDFFYAVPSILEIHEIKEEYGFYRWRTTTDRGERAFYVKGRADNVKAAGDNRLFVTDIHNCRYQIGDAEALPRVSRAQLHKVL